MLGSSPPSTDSNLLNQPHFILWYHHLQHMVSTIFKEEKKSRRWGMGYLQRGYFLKMSDITSALILLPITQSHASFNCKEAW